MDDSDEALMARVARGDERAFQVLSRRHLPAMLGLARRILGNTGDAEDVAQEAFVRVWTHAPRWQPLAQFARGLRAWSSISVSTASGAHPGWTSRRPAMWSIPDPGPMKRQRATSESECSRRRSTSFPRASATQS